MLQVRLHHRNANTRIELYDIGRIETDIRQVQDRAGISGMLALDYIDVVVKRECNVWNRPVGEKIFKLYRAWFHMA